MSYTEWVALYKSMHDLVKFFNWKANFTNEADRAIDTHIVRAWYWFDRNTNLLKSGYLPTILPSDIDTQLKLCKKICQESDNMMQEQVKLHIISKVDAILEQLRNFRIRVPELQKLRNFGLRGRSREFDIGSRSNVYLVQKKLFY